MIIYFIRHGHPDYVNDTLTELGHKHAKAAAERLKHYGIEKIFSSTNGRAHLTAEYTARVLGLDIVPLEFMREISWSPLRGEKSEICDPWGVSRIFANEGKSLDRCDWYLEEPFCNSKIVESYNTVIEGFDSWLLDLGYMREGDFYRVVGDNTDKTVALFSHGGSSSAAISHMLCIPFIRFCSMFHIDFTGITAIELPDEKGKLVCPRLLFSDATHILSI